MINISADIREAIVGNAPITALLGVWSGEPAVHSRRPVPKDSPYPMVVINIVNGQDIDALNSARPVLTYDVVVYGRQKDDFRNVETAAFLIRNLFHRQRFAIAPDGFNVVNITCNGPRVAPTSDDTLVGRVVTLTATLRQE